MLVHNGSKSFLYSPNTPNFNYSKSKKYAYKYTWKGEIKAGVDPAMLLPAVFS